MPLVQTRGAASAQGFGEFAQAATVANYIEQVFSTYLYTGTGAALTITNNIDLSTKGGLVWLKDRIGATSHQLYDTQRGVEKVIYSNLTNAQATSTETVTAFNTTGFTVGQYGVNSIGQSPVSWTFRKQSKFFDVVTYTGTGSARTIAHNLGSVPGCIIVKNLTTAGDWRVYHRGLTSADYDIRLNLTNAQASVPSAWNSTAPTSAVFSLGANGDTNGSGDSFVGYLFAHDAGGFGLTGTDNVISCGSFTTDSSGNASVTLGYEPQWVIQKAINAAYGWWMNDNMRGMPVSGGTAQLNAEGAYAEALTSSLGIRPNATGFTVANGVNTKTFIYIAIRRGPMKVPTTGTSVFAPILQSNANTPPRTISGAGFAPDLMLQGTYQYANGASAYDRLRGQVTLLPPYTDPEASEVSTGASFTMDGISYTGTGTINNNGNAVDWFFRRAPSFFDEVCYTGNGSVLTFDHNLTVAPELIFIKKRSAAIDWFVGSKFTAGNSLYAVLNTDGAGITYSYPTYLNSQPTATTVSVYSNNLVNTSAATYVAYLFATCAGVSKVGSFTGNGSTQTINCGFTGGARFVLIKRTDSTGDWYVYDTARGMTVLTNPYLLLNLASTGAATLGSVTTVTTGFALNSAILAAINVNAGTYIFLAIA